MSSPRSSDETTVNASYSVTVPAEIRSSLDIEPGDTLRWTLDDDGELSVSVIEEEQGALSELEPVDIGTETNSVDLERDFGAPDK